MIWIRKIHIYLDNPHSSNMNTYINDEIHVNVNKIIKSVTKTAAESRQNNFYPFN